MPEMKSISTQVEMDEFMTLRRLNIEIQGYPESYAAEPLDKVGSEVGDPPPPPQEPLSNEGSARPPLDNATNVNLDGEGIKYEGGPLPPSPTNKRIKSSNDVVCL